MTKSDRPILMARIGAPHGIRGEVRVKSFTEDPQAIGDYGPLFDEKGNRFTIVSARPAKNMLVVRFKEITTREAAERLNNTELFVDRSALPDIDEEDEFYLSDLIGMRVVDENGKTIGKIRDVPNFGADDMLEIIPAKPDGSFGGQTFYLPFTRQVVPEIDLQNGKVTIVPPPETEAREEQG